MTIFLTIVLVIVCTLSILTIVSLRQQVSNLNKKLEDLQVEYNSLNKLL